MENSEYFKHIDNFLKKVERDKMLSQTIVRFSIIPKVVKQIMDNQKYSVYFTDSTFIDSFDYSDIIIKTPSMYLYFSKSVMDTTYNLKIIHENNTEEIKIFLKGLKQINKI